MEPTFIWIIISISTSIFALCVYLLSVVVIRNYAYSYFKYGDILKSKSLGTKHTILITKKRNNKFEYKICNQYGNVTNSQVYSANPDHILYHYKKLGKIKPHLRVIK